jgi:hypothetical protein
VIVGGRHRWMRGVLLATMLGLGCSRPAAVAPAEVFVAPVEEDPQPPPPPRPTMRIADAEPGGIQEKCGPEYRDECLQAKAYPEERLHWSFEVEPACRGKDGDCAAGPAAPVLVAAVAALLEYDAEHVQVHRRSVSALVGYAGAVMAGRLAGIARISVECTESAFCSCADLPVERCSEHTFCNPIRAQAIGARCISAERELVGCGQSRVCGASMTDAWASDGTLWRFGSTCLPDQPGWQALENIVERPWCDPS